MENYEKVRIVGRGAFGVCWLCRRKTAPVGQKVIVKSITIGGGAEEEEKVMSEVKLLQKMKHPMIIGYYDFFKMVSENSIVIVMQYAEGGTMEKMIQDQNGTFFSNNLALNYFTQIAIALNHIHSKNIVHRDLKTQNILLNKKRNLVKLSDFGISRELSTRSMAATVIGTPNYLSPEICEGRSYNHKSDIWSLGCVLYELLQLKRAFEGENIPSIVMKISKGTFPPLGDHVPDEVKRLVLDLLHMDSDKRPAIKEYLFKRLLVKSIPEDILTCPLILPHNLNLHIDIGRLVQPTSGDKRKPSVVAGSRLRTMAQPVTQRGGLPSF